MDDTKNLPTQNKEAETSLLGAVLIDPEAMIRIGDIVHADDFYNPEHQLIYTAMVDLYEARQPIDLLTLASKLEDNDALQKAGGSAYLTSLVDSVPSASNAAHYAGIVAHKATLRRLILAANKIGDLGHNETEELDGLLDKAEQTLFEVSQKHLKQNFIAISSVLADSFDRLDELHRDKKKFRGLPTGFRELDNKLAGLQKSDLIILAARPAMGNYLGLKYCPKCCHPARCTGWSL